MLRKKHSWHVGMNQSHLRFHAERAESRKYLLSRSLPRRIPHPHQGHHPRQRSTRHRLWFPRMRFRKGRRSHRILLGRWARGMARSVWIPCSAASPKRLLHNRKRISKKPANRTQRLRWWLKRKSMRQRCLHKMVPVQHCPRWWLLKQRTRAPKSRGHRLRRRRRRETRHSKMGCGVTPSRISRRQLPPVLLPSRTPTTPTAPLPTSRTRRGRRRWKTLERRCGASQTSAKGSTEKDRRCWRWGGRKRQSKR
mmetsp:Transcript_55496/g.113478  ORF Transcript_55496/g.113478 Transcript_55496/m.113478 type:complete len:252 (+) Transcript_55496:154-909(+)